MTADTITAEKVADLLAILRSAAESAEYLLHQINHGEIDPQTASEIVNESIHTINTWNQ